MAHSSTVQVLKVIDEEKTSKKGEKYQVRMAEVIIIDDDGQIEVTGPMRLSEALLEGLKPGVYRAGFSMVRNTYGDNKGEIGSRCVSLTPVPTRGNVPSVTPATSAPPAPVRT